MMTSLMVAVLMIAAGTGNADAPQAKSGNQPAVRESPIAKSAIVAETFPRRWQKASDILGMKVLNETDEHLGKIEDLVINATNGRIVYAILSLSGLKAVGGKRFAVPIEALTLTGDQKALVLNIGKQKLESSESFDDGKWPDFADASMAGRLYAAYQQRPYWEREDRARAGDSWNERMTVWYRATDLIGKAVDNPQNQELGRTTDLVLDLDHARVVYAIVGLREALFAIPWGAIHLDGERTHVVVATTTDRLDLFRFTKNAWPQVTDPAWAAEIHNAFGQARYWEN